MCIFIYQDTKLEKKTPKNVGKKWSLIMTRSRFLSLIPMTSQILSLVTTIGGGTYRLSETWASLKFGAYRLSLTRIMNSIFDRTKAWTHLSDEYYFSAKIPTSNMLIYMLWRRKVRNSDNSKLMNHMSLWFTAIAFILFTWSSHMY